MTTVNVTRVWPKTTVNNVKKCLQSSQVTFTVFSIRSSLFGHLDLVILTRLVINLGLKMTSLGKKPAVPTSKPANLKFVRAYMPYQVTTFVMQISVVVSFKIWETFMSPVS